MKIIKKMQDVARRPKTQLAVGLAVAAIGLLAPKHSKSTSYCTPGNSGDCVLITDGNKHCSVGSFWNDCN